MSHRSLWISRDHVFMLHRPNTIPEAQRSQAAPPVLEFDAAGKFVNAWGGPGQGFDWPDSEHGIAVDYKNNVWIGGSAPVAPSLRNLDDDMLLKFDNKGKFLLQIGGRSVSKGNADTKTVHQSADVFVWPKTNEAFVADGYGNRRVIVFDADTGAFKRQWGAFGNTPIDVSRPRGGGAGGARRRRRARGRRWCSWWRRRGAALDIEGQRVRAIRRAGARCEGLERRARLRGRPSEPSRAGVHAGRKVRHADVHQPIRPVGAVSRRARVLPRHTAAIPLRRRLRQLAHRCARAQEPALLYQFGQRSEKPGDFQGLHHLAIDSKGTSTPARLRRAHVRSASCSKDFRTRFRPTRSRQLRRQPRALGPARSRRRVRRAAAIRTWTSTMASPYQ